jgi:Tol biopolymer transport system component
MALAWSPDGMRIAFSNSGTGPAGSVALHVMNADGSNIQYIGQSMGYYSVSGIAWSLDSRKLGLVINQDNLCPWDCDSALGMVNPDGTGFQVLATAQTSHPSTAEALYIDFPSWSPDGAHLMYTLCSVCNGVGTGFNQVWGWDVAAGVSRQLVSNATYGSWRP